MPDISPVDDFEEEALPPDVQELVAPEVLEYAPWHRPRKQYVRQKQWVRHTVGIVKKLKELGYFGHGTPLKYLTLPGPDLLDISLVTDVCTQEGVQIRYTGFCLADEKEESRLRRNLNEFGIQRQEAVFGGSKIVNSKIEDVAIRRSDARVAMEQGGPFDIVNIDACEPIANGHDTTGSLVQAIRAIAEYQLAATRTPWILCLTTPIQTESISAASLGALHGQIIANANSDKRFADELAELLVSEGAGIDDLLKTACAQNGTNLVRVFSLGLSKWLIHMAEQANFAVKKLDGYCYSMFKRPPHLPNMVSLCFLFEPQAIRIEDKSGLTRNPVVQITTQPISDHIRALRRSFGVANIDEILVGNQELFEAMVNETKELLRSVGYPVDDPVLGYDAWLAAQPTYDPSLEADEAAIV
ncbi:PP_RS20740 family protein [Devosia sp.]|uniref:PP_RS20740 family protein n=1 Tax=Devosia sp. TaxID=1871048 RepID=UPI002931D1E9|nr:hypothetical protein [Devosia sp.]